jgi:hypothetical protein
MISCTEERTTTSLENNNLKKKCKCPHYPICGARRNEPMGQNGALLWLIVFVQEAQICTLVTSSPAQDLCAHFPQCPQPTQISVDTEYSSLQYRHAVSSLLPEVEIHCSDTLDFFVDFRMSFILDVLFNVDPTRSCLYGDEIKTQ